MFDYWLHVFSSFCNHQFKLCRKLRDSKAVDDEVICSSGPARSHETNMKPVQVGPRVVHREQFVCRGGVDTARLLDLSRKGLFSTAKEMGGNILLEEQ